MIYLLTANGLTPDDSSTVHIYTQTIRGTKQNKKCIEQHKNFGRVRAVSRICGVYPSICLTTEEKVKKVKVKPPHYRPGQTLQGSRRLRLPDFMTFGT